MKLTLKVWRQDGNDSDGRFENYELDGVSEDSSILEMMDQLNEQLLSQGIEPVLFDHDCREVNLENFAPFTRSSGYAHVLEDSTTTCQLHMRKFLAMVKPLPSNHFEPRPFRLSVTW